MHLMRWWQLFPKIFLYPYHLRTRLKSIFIVGISWKITQVTRMPAWLIFVRSEEDDPLRPQPSTLSWRDHLFWDLPSHLLLLGRIPISKWGLRPNIRVQAFAPIVIYNIFCIIKNYIKFENFSFSFKQTFSNQKFSTIKSKTPRNLSKKLIKLNKTTI